MLTATQRGTAGEQLFAACVTLSSVGELELFKPLTDDDHTDVTAGRRGNVPAVAIQVKTALSLDKKDLAVARMSFPDGKPREHAAYVYAIVYVTNASVESAWIVPSRDFNRLSYRGAGRRGKGIELQFMASPTRSDRWSAFRCGRMDLGPRLIELISGFDVVEALRAEEATRSIPIMVLTAKTLTEDDKTAFNGQVAAIFHRNSVAGTELTTWLRGIVAKRLVPA